MLDERTDIYSLGITLYELLTLRPAFSNHDRQTILRQVTGEEPPRPRQIDPRIPRFGNDCLESGLQRCRGPVSDGSALGRRSSAVLVTSADSSAAADAD